MNIVVSYTDNTKEKKTRWGYLTSDGIKLFDEYIKKMKQQKEEGEGNNEILDANIMQMSKMSVVVFLPDGTTGDAELRHLTIVPPFVQYSTAPKKQQEEKSENN